jgi:ribose/xylose/arabinose/galactoside ABC-type transport system permease subunit
MSDLGRLLIGLGLLLVIIGIAVVLFARWNVPLGRLPGDFSWRGKGWTVSFPLASSLLISVLLTLLLWIISHFRR